MYTSFQLFCALRLALFSFWRIPLFSGEAVHDAFTCLHELFLLVPHHQVCTDKRSICSQQHVCCDQIISWVINSRLVVCSSSSRGNCWLLALFITLGRLGQIRTIMCKTQHCFLKLHRHLLSYLHFSLHTLQASTQLCNILGEVELPSHHLKQNLVVFNRTLKMQPRLISVRTIRG